ncbi:MAG TPA: FAD-dependent oxidoreductase [Bryobacteraceae bacterium]|nr:FAD-dependent oxidoreductase [Bryobacteraceae bacterium]
MADDKSNDLSGPDLKEGIPVSDLKEGEPFLGHFDGDAVLLVRKGEQVRAIGAQCTHYGGPLSEGLVEGDTIRCPWHHARFSLLTGEAEGAPALNPVTCFGVTHRDGKVIVSRKAEVDYRVPFTQNPSSVVIVGAGAAGAACADMLRTKGYAGPVTLIGNEEPGPVDRPNLSKDFLAGTASEEWIPLRTRDYYESIHVDLVTDDPATGISPEAHEVTLASGRRVGYGALLIATGAEPRTLPIPGGDLPHVHRLRSFADCKGIIAAALRVKTCAVIGSSFIAMEVAASLRQRGLEVTVIGPDAIPLAGILGPDVGRFVQTLHEQHGVRFCLGAKPQVIREDHVETSDGQRVKADLIVLGVGVKPRTELAERAGLQVDNGIVVTETLLASAPDIYAAGDVARYPDWLSGEKIRIEHWVVAERQGQAAARSMLGIGGSFRNVPFFWSQHYDVAISYVGHAASWDTCDIRGNLATQNVCAIYRRNGKTAAIATIGRDRVSLAAEAALERGDFPGLESILQNQ